MIALLKTAERTSPTSFINNYVYQRHVFAYKYARRHQLTGPRILEVGCGEGYGMALLSSSTEQYVAVDKKKPAEHFFSGNTTFLNCNLPDLSGIEDHSFNTVICFQVIEHIKKDNSLLAEMKRVLKPGGKLLLTTPNKLLSLTRNPFHVREYTPVEMCTLIAAHFRDFSVEGVYGNNKVMAYYHENKKSVSAITKYDLLDLQHKLPACLLKIPYTLLNNLNRLMLLRKIEDVTANIGSSDFYLQPLRDDCLDYFITATKEDGPRHHVKLYHHL